MSKHLLPAVFFLATVARAIEPTAPPALAQVGSIPLPQITASMNHFSADAEHERFFLTGTSDHQLLVIDLKTNKVTHTIKGYAPAAARFAPDLNRLCVSGAKAVHIYDASSFDELATIDVNSSVDELQYDPKTHLLYAGLQDAKSPAIAVIDVQNHKLLDRIKLPSAAQGFVLENQGPRLFANTTDSSQVTVIDRSTKSIIGEWKLDAAEYNYPLALDEKTHRLFVGCRKPAQVLMLDSDSGKLLASAEIGRDTDDMSFDPATHRAYLACGSGVLSIVQEDDADHCHTLANIPTAPGSRNSLFVPELKRFYLAVPPQDGRPAELRVFKTSD